ncbi:flippase-like domain-containing protein [Micrococcales bacterium 31B]|nr:flippase-like domain-containing protein [Micrococcales bacterium 31B]
MMRGNLRALLQGVLGVLVLVAVVRFAGTETWGTAWARLTGTATGTALPTFALVVTFVATCAAALRWSLVASAAGLHLPVGVAVAACYRSQLLNATVPGGIVGDVNRAVDDRHAASTTLRTRARVVIVERVLGQVVQAALTLVALAWLPSPWRPAAGAAALLTAAGLLAVTLAGWCAVSRGYVRRDDLSRVGGTSALVVLSHAAIFVAVAMTVTGRPLDAHLIVLAALVLAGAAIPINVAGWGPREGVAVWAGTHLGLSAPDALAVSVAFGVLGTIALAPGVLTWLPQSLFARPREGSHG